jgi:hypothetical protein
MNWDQIETNWAAMTLRVRPDLRIALPRQAPPGTETALSDDSAPDPQAPAPAPLPRPLA